MINYKTSNLHTLWYLTVPGSTLPGLFRTLYRGKEEKEIGGLERFVDDLACSMFPTVVESWKFSIWAVITGYISGMS